MGIQLCHSARSHVTPPCACAQVAPAAATLPCRSCTLCLASAFLSPTHPPGCAGALFWQWFNDGQEAGVTEGGGRGLYGEWDDWAGVAGRLGLG